MLCRPIVSFALHFNLPMAHEKCGDQMRSVNVHDEKYMSDKFSFHGPLT